VKFKIAASRTIYTINAYPEDGQHGFRTIGTRTTRDKPTQALRMLEVTVSAGQGAVAMHTAATRYVDDTHGEISDKTLRHSMLHPILSHSAVTDLKSNPMKCKSTTHNLHKKWCPPRIRQMVCTVATYGCTPRCLDPSGDRHMQHCKIKFDIECEILRCRPPTNTPCKWCTSRPQCRDLGTQMQKHSRYALP
jgi:hypothetical protein